MVLESLINPINAEKRPVTMLFLGFLYASVGLFMSIWIFKDQASLVFVFLTVIACVPLVYNTIKLEEKKDLTISKESFLLKEHGKALLFFMFLFMGFTLAYALWYVILPSSIIQSSFSTQIQTIISLGSEVTGAATSLSVLGKVFFNNLKVLMFCILFAFLYGVGAIFILTWNASVIGVAIGNFIRRNIASIAVKFHLGSIGSYFQIISLGLLRYSIHGIPEILAYFTGGLAGGIISIAVIRHDFGTNKFERILLDSSDLIIISVLLLVVAAVLEVYITPILF